MFMNFIHSINWVDILLVALAVRIIYVGMHTGFVAEFFKVVGLFLTLFVSFQYYTLLADVLKVGNIPEWLVVTFSFSLICVLMTILCFLIRHGIFMLFTVQTVSAVDKWGGAVMSVGRFFITASLVTYAFLVTGNKYLQTKTMEAVSHKYVVFVAPEIYKSLSEGFVSRLLPNVKYNTAVRETLKDVK
jgi:uncharacterized membrane protein required for colicin V production